MFLHPPSQVEVKVTVFCASESDDAETRKVMNFFLRLTPPASVVLQLWELPMEQLLRRSIGRNLAARATRADWVWLADCDMAFGEGALDALQQELTPKDMILAFPSQVLIHQTHAIGDAAIQRVLPGAGLLDVRSAEFVPKKYYRAIGGAQIVLGEVIRKSGYCPQRRWQRPAERWYPTKEDIIFRRQLGTPGVAIDVPNVFRLRHSQCGRRCADLHL
ncbi:MAG: hypothetical protein J0M17_18025 [Planctomycetes bacterium]|nr:hypothetical protein [Planctomycetota bacterium]